MAICMETMTATSTKGALAKILTAFATEVPRSTFFHPRINVECCRKLREGG